MHTMNNEENEYCLRWHKHFSNFVESFEALLSNEALADVVFFVEGQLVKAHKVVLSFCSQYFQNLFKETIDKYPIIVLKDVKQEHIKMLLEFMYTGQVNVPQDALKPIMKIAQTLCIKGLADGVVDIEKIPDIDDTPMSLIHPKSANNRYNAPPHPHSHMEPKLSRPLPAMYSTSSPSVLSTALTMPSALSLASPLSLPHLASLPPNFASSLASTLSSAMPQAISSFMPPRDLPERDRCESPLLKRRKRHRRRSGEAHDSGDSDGRSSGSPGDSVQNIQLPKIPATITPIGLHRQHSQHFQHLSHLQPQHQPQQQPRDLSIHSSENQNNAHTNHHDRSLHFSPHRDRLQTIKLPPNIPGLLHHPPLENHSKPQDEPENLEHRPQQTPKEGEERVPKTEPIGEEPSNNHSDSSAHEDKSSPVTSERRSNDGSIPLRVSPKFNSDPESVSPVKTLPQQGRLEETSSDNNHFSDDERDENNSGPKENLNERLSDSTPGPSTSRPHSEEAPNTPSFLGWPYSADPNATDEHFANFSEANHDYFRALNLVRAAGISGILPQRLSADLYARPPVPINIPLLLKGHEKSNPKNLLGYPFQDTPKQFACDKCGRSYASTGNLKRHKKYECGVEPQFSCPVCRKKFQHRHSVKIHIYSTHRNEAGDHGTEPNREAPGILSTDGVPAVGSPSWISQEASTAALQKQD